MDKQKYLAQLSFEIKKGWINTEKNMLEVSIPLYLGFTINELEEFCQKNNVFLFEFGKRILIRGCRKREITFVPVQNNNRLINSNSISDSSDMKIEAKELDEWIYFDYDSYMKNASF